MSNMRAADVQAESVRSSLDDLEKAAATAAVTLNSVKADASQATATKAYAAEMQKAVEGIAVSAQGAKDAIQDVNLQQAQVVSFIAKAEVIKAELKDIKDEANDASRALGGLEISSADVGRRGSAGRFLPGRMFIGGPVEPDSFVRGTTPTDAQLIERWAKMFRKMPLELTERAGGGIPLGGPTSSQESFVRGIAGDFARIDKTLLRGRMVGLFGQNDLPPNPILRMTQLGTGDIRGAERFLKSRGIVHDAEALGGIGMFRRTTDDTVSIAKSLGWGGGGGIKIPRMLGWGFGRGFGRGPLRLFPGMAKFGSLLGLAGFGAERALTSSLGIVGSLGAGLLGGGLLGAGALGTMAVGAGTDLAGIGQAAGDTKTVSHDLGQLSDAIQRYGKNSRQAADAQAQLNQDLKSFSPVARNAVLAAAQTSRGFRAMFDKVTGPAEKTGANIINQAMRTGEKFLPTIGTFAAQNMNIIQRGIQPLFAWMKQGGSSGGLGIFRDLEKIFQKNLPTAVHALTQFFEFFVKTIDVAAQRTGGFTKKIDAFFTKWNQPQFFSKWAKEVNKLIDLFHIWMGLFGAIGRALFNLFKPAVGLGAVFAKGLTNIIDKMTAWLKLGSTQDTLGQLFTAHADELKSIFALFTALLPTLLQAAQAFLQVSAIVSELAAGALGQLARALNTILSMPLIKQILGWVAALYLMRSAIMAVMKVLGLGGLLSTLSKMGTGFVATAGEATGLIGVIGRLKLALLGIAGMVVTVAIVYDIIKQYLPGIGAGPNVSGIGPQSIGAAASNQYKNTKGVQQIKSDPQRFALAQKIESMRQSGMSNAQIKATLTKQGVNDLFATQGLVDAQVLARNQLASGAGSSGALSYLPSMLKLPANISHELLAAQNMTNINKEQAANTKANKDALSYYNRLLAIPGLTTAQKNAILQARAPYAQGVMYNPSSLPGGITGGGGTGSAGGTLASLVGGHLASQLSNAQGAAASGTPQSLKHLLAVEQKVLASLNAQNLTGKKMVEQARERAILEKEIARTRKDLSSSNTNSLASHILGIARDPNATPSAKSLMFRERTMLSKLMVGAGLGTGAHDSLPKMIKELQHAGFPFTKSTLESLKKINEVFALHGKLQAGILTNIRDRLTQIRDALTHTYGSNYIPITSASLVKGLHLSPQDRAVAEQRIAQALAHHGMKPGGPAIAGLPLLKSTKDVSTVGSTVGMHLRVPYPKQGIGSVPHTVIHIGNVTITIPGTGKDAKKLAHEIRAELLKNSRRNPAQTKGPNAGRSVGLG